MTTLSNDLLARLVAAAMMLLLVLPLLVMDTTPALAAPGTPVQIHTTSGNPSQLLARQPDTAFGPDATTGTVIDVDARVRHQPIDGFGGALTESSAHLIAGLPAQQRAQLLTRLYAPQGLNFSAVRVPMGSSDFALTMRTYNDLGRNQTDPKLERFSIDADRPAILPILAEIQSQQPDLWVMATPWSAPAWMKSSKSLIGGSLQSKQASTYGAYFRRFVDDYAAAGVRVHAVSPQNEPLHVPHDYPGMSMTAAQQATFVADHLGPALRGTGTKILAFDHNWADASYAADVLGTRARPHLAGAAFHCYAGEPEMVSAVTRAHPTAEIHMTECASGGWSTDWNANLRWDVRTLLIRAGRAGSRTAIKWNLALDPTGGPRIGGCTNCRGMVTIDPATQRVTENHDVYALGHASKFVRPGAVRIDSTSLPGQQLESIAYANPDGSIALVVLNDGGPRTVRLRAAGGSLSHALPGWSVTTFAWQGAPAT